VQQVVTWYDILDVMPGASTEEVQGKYDAQSRPVASGAHRRRAINPDHRSLAGAAAPRLGTARARRPRNPGPL